MIGDGDDRPVDARGQAVQLVRDGAEQAVGAPTDDAAYEAAYRAHYWHVVAYLQRRLGEQEAARDAAQDVFGVAWVRRADLPAEPLPWLYAVAHNVARNQWRLRRSGEQARRRLWVLARADAGGARDPMAGVDEGVDADLARALGRLREADREILRLTAWEGLAPAEAAVVLGCTPNAAASRLSRARRRLRAALAGSTDVRASTPAEET